MPHPVSLASSFNLTQVWTSEMLAHRQTCVLINLLAIHGEEEAREKERGTKSWPCEPKQMSLACLIDEKVQPFVLPEDRTGRERSLQSLLMTHVHIFLCTL